MSDHPDYIRMRGHINRVKSEFPALDPDLIERIHQHFVVVQLRQPTPEEFRAYVVELTTDLDEPTLRGMLGLPPKTSAGPTDGRRRTTASAGGDGRGAPRRRSSGRPKGTRSATRDQIIETFRSLRTRQRRRPTQVQLAANLKPPIAVRTLQALLAEYGLPWPIE